MKTILDEGDEVKFKSYCLKHSQNRQKLGEPEYPLHRAAEQSQAKSEKTSLRAQKLRELEEEFYSLVRVEDVATELGMPTLAVDFIYNYWKLKRKSNFNKPLFPPKQDEENGLVQPKEESIHTRMRMFMHLRQDLERVSCSPVAAVQARPAEERWPCFRFVCGFLKVSSRIVRASVSLLVC